MSLKSTLVILSCILSFLTIIATEENADGNIDNDVKNYTITCEINGEKRYGDECLDSLKKFGKFVGYIITGVIVAIVICCCGCCCCVCKIIHSNKSRTRGGQVFQHNANIAMPTQNPNVPVIATVA